MRTNGGSLNLVLPGLTLNRWAHQWDESFTALVVRAIPPGFFSADLGIVGGVEGGVDILLSLPGPGVLEYLLGIGGGGPDPTWFAVGEMGEMGGVCNMFGPGVIECLSYDEGGCAYIGGGG